MRPLNRTDIILGPQASLKGPEGISFQVGEVMKGFVFKILSANLVLIQVKNHLIEAKTEIPLQAGEHLYFEVVSTEGQVHLKRLPGPVSTNASVLLFKALDVLGEKRGFVPLQQILAQLRDLPEALLKKLPDFKVLEQFFKVFSDVSAAKLKTAIASSGLFFEAKIKSLLMDAAPDKNNTEALRKAFQLMIQGDLKGTLLKLKGDLQSKILLAALAKNGVDSQALLREIDLLLNEITYQQFESKLKEGVQVFVPFLWKGLQEGRMIFRRSGQDDENSPDKPGCSCTIFLKLEKIGKLKAHIQMVSGLFYARLVSENARFVHLLEAGRERLKTQLSSTGLQWADISVRHQLEINFEEALSDGIDLKV